MIIIDLYISSNIVSEVAAEPSSAADADSLDDTQSGRHDDGSIKSEFLALDVAYVRQEEGDHLQDLEKMDEKQDNMGQLPTLITAARENSPGKRPTLVELT